jgi:hypothetical protein
MGKGREIREGNEEKEVEYEGWRRKRKEIQE